MKTGLHKKLMFVQDINKWTPLTKNETSLQNSERFSVPDFPDPNEGSSQLKPLSLNPIYKHLPIHVSVS